MNKLLAVSVLLLAIFVVPVSGDKLTKLSLLYKIAYHNSFSGVHFPGTGNLLYRRHRRLVVSDRCTCFFGTFDCHV